MLQNKPLNVAIVGGGPGCKAIMDMIFAQKLSQLRMHLVGVADLNPDAVGYRYAQEKGVFTTQEYRELFALEDLDLIIEVTGQEAIADEIFRTKPAHVRVMGNVAARLFWDVFQIEERMTQERTRAEQVLREDRLFLQAVFNAIQEGMTIVDIDFNILRVNRWVENNYASQMPLVGKKCYEAYQKRKAPCPRCPTVSTLADGTTHNAVLPYPCAKEGPTRWIDLSAFPLKNTTGHVVAVIEYMKDITAQQEAERELKRKHEELNAINGVLLSVTKEYTLNGMGRVLENIMAGFYPGFDAAMVLLAPDRKGLYFPRPERGQPLETCFDRAQKRIKRLNLEDDLLAALLAKGKMSAMGSGRGSATCPEPIRRLAAGFRTWMAVPIELEDRCYGVFMLGASSVDMIVENELIFVEALIRQISGVIRYQLSKEVREEAFREQLTGPDKFMGIVGRSQPMQEVYQVIQAVADSPTTVLITGESGTGKELVARAIHRTGSHRDRPFVVAHCSSFVPTLLHSEIFGHEKGAFTGAVSRKRGRLERARGGILFLDEVADLPLETQVLLLRFLQEKSFERVGGESPVEVNVRIIAATNKDIEKEMTTGRLREDFYYRLNVIRIQLPPLRERMADLPLLSEHFLRTHCLIERKEIEVFTTEAMSAMMDYNWPGNVRELENTIARCVVLTTGRRIGVEALPDRVRERANPPQVFSLAERERDLIATVMRDCRWNKHAAARLLNISRATLYSKLRKYDVRP